MGWPVILGWSIHEQDVGGHEEDEAEDGAGHVPGVARHVLIQDLVEGLRGNVVFARSPLC